jgi:hypothetical protein
MTTSPRLQDNTRHIPGHAYSSVFRIVRATRTTRKQLSICLPMDSSFYQDCLNLGFLAVEYKWRILLRIAWTWLSTDEISMNFCYLVCSGHGHRNLEMQSWADGDSCSNLVHFASLRPYYKISTPTNSNSYILQSPRQIHLPFHSNTKGNQESNKLFSFW